MKDAASEPLPASNQQLGDGEGLLEAVCQNGTININHGVIYLNGRYAILGGWTWTLRQDKPTAKRGSFLMVYLKKIFEIRTAIILSLYNRINRSCSPSITNESFI